MKTIYKFYIGTRQEENFLEEENWVRESLCEYDADEWNKEEMCYNVIYEQFPSYKYCMREKWVDGVRRYTAPYLLSKRRENPNYINNYKQGLLVEQAY